MSQFLGFTTYPTKIAIHGGQRRVRAFVEFYKSLGIDYQTACIYEPAHYSTQHVDTHDVPLRTHISSFDGIPFVNDLQSGIFAAQNPDVRRHFTQLVLQKKPRAIVLEHPFMWPLVKKLREDSTLAEIPLIYSSHNWEGPLKRDILVRTGVDESDAHRISQQIEQLEREVVSASNLILAVSESDAATYRTLSPDARVIVVHNGVDRIAAPGTSDDARMQVLGDQRYFFFVGSAYPPNVDGICELLLEGGLFFVPPEKTFAMCGGAAGGIFRDPRYQKFLSANSERVHFFEKIDDGDLAFLKSHAHAVLLPINFGGGSNLKTAEALASGKWVIATPTSMRGYEEFIDEPGVVIAADRRAFRRAVMEVWRKPPLELTAAARDRRESVYWDRRFDHLHPELARLNLIQK